MTTTRSDFGQPAAAPSPVSSFVEERSLALQAAHKRIRTAFAAWRLRRRQRAELHALSDAALKDFGVSRWEIDSIVNSPDRDASGRVR